MIKKIMIGFVTASVLSTSAIACPKNSGEKACYYQAGHSTVSKVIRAVSKTGLSAAQTRKIAEGIAEYEAMAEKIKKMEIFPVDSFINEEFDEQRFIKEMSEKYVSAVAARATLYKYVFAVLDKEQRKIFKREYAAPLISKMIKSY
ncbi:MAG: hypothetical protein ISR67_04920 [Sulfurimonas sp.]|nr:hypothetical protein [Sulfurimonas sp.]